MGRTFHADIDLDGNEVKKLRAENTDPPPTSPNLGQIYFDTGDSRFYGWNGSSWILLDEQDTAGSSLATKSGELAAVAFAGNPKVASVTFGTAFADANYSISVIGEDKKNWNVANITASGFDIDSNSNKALTAPVRWIAVKHGES